MTPSILDQPAVDRVELAVHSELVSAIVGDVFSTMLQTSAVLAADAAPPEKPFPVAGAIYFTGGFMGAVVIELGYELAFQATAALMSAPKPNEVDPDVCDSIGELTNIIAGNLKAILPADAQLSMPSVVEGDDFALSVIGANISSRMLFDSPHGRLSLTLVQMQPRRPY